jgi:hypothetical protein
MRTLSFLLLGYCKNNSNYFVNIYTNFSNSNKELKANSFFDFKINIPNKKEKEIYYFFEVKIYKYNLFFWHFVKNSIKYAMCEMNK